LFKKLPITVSL